MMAGRIVSFLVLGVLLISSISVLEMDVDGKDGSFGGGNGTLNDPYVIEDVWDLQNISSNLTAHYVLANDIDALVTKTWNSGKGFIPIGNRSYHFKGSFDGRGQTISGLNIDRPNEDYVGLFGYVEDITSVRNLTLTGISIRGYRYVGGLIGLNGGVVDGCQVNGEVSGGYYFIGGSIGYNWYGKVTDCSMRGNVSNQGEFTGGFVGYNSQGTLVNCSSVVELNGNGSSSPYHGGFSGYNYLGTIANCFTTGNVTSTAGVVGGFLGNNLDGDITNCSFKGSVKGGKYVGGLSGVHNYGTLSSCTVRGSVEGYDWIGGIAGIHGGGNIVNCTGSLNASGEKFIGGLVGEIQLGKISESFLTGYVSGSEDVGGLVGKNWGEVADCWNSASVVSNGIRTGGIVGLNNGTISGCFEEGNVNGIDNVGGLVGESNGIISDCYATGNVIGNGTVGGLLGLNNASSSVSRCYATGGVMGKYWLGGLIGRNLGTESYSFWDTDTSGIGTSEGGTGKGTEEMRRISTFIDANWNFIDTWAIIEHGTYPFLRWQDREPPIANAGPDQVVEGGALVTFDGSLSHDDMGIANYTWTVQDNALTTLYGDRPMYRFYTLGDFKVTLKVTDATGKWDSETMNLSVIDTSPPVADAGPDQVVDSFVPVKFDGSASWDDLGIVNWTWTFNEGGEIGLHGVMVQHRFQTLGYFVVTLNVSDGVGNWDTDSMNVSVIDVTGPVADAGADRMIDEGAILLFDGSSSHDDVRIASLIWTFEDDGPVILYGIYPIYRFDTPGTYIVTLNVTDTSGNWDIDTITVTVMVLVQVDDIDPVADAGPDRIADVGTIVTFDGSGSMDNIGIVDYTWTFIYGNMTIVLEGVSPSFTFDIPGRYIVVLNVSDAVGNRDEDGLELAVNDISIVDDILPIANAGDDRTVPAGTLVVLDGSLSYDNDIIGTYIWSFANGGNERSLYGPIITFRFDIGGIYEITLTVMDRSGNFNVDSLTVTVIDTGRVYGTVHDDKGNIVSGASVVITASNGETYSTTTGPNGSFSMELYYGNFTWKISKEGYRTISGSSSVKAMGEALLDLSDHPLVREEKKKDRSSLFLFVLLAVLILMVLGIAFYLLIRKKEGYIEE